MAISTGVGDGDGAGVGGRVPFKIKMFLMHERFLMERNEMKANGLEVNQPARDDNDNVRSIAAGGARGRTRQYV